MGDGSTDENPPNLLVYPDLENDRVRLEDSWLVVQDSSGERMTIDHADGQDGYIVFAEQSGDGLVRTDGEKVTLQLFHDSEVDYD
jgi:hypothetical protein